MAGAEQSILGHPNQQVRDANPLTSQGQRSHSPPLTRRGKPNSPTVADGILTRIDDHLSSRTQCDHLSRIHAGPEDEQYENKKENSIREHYRHADNFASEIEENWTEKQEDFVHNAILSKIKTNERHLFIVYALKDEALKTLRDN